MNAALRLGAPRGRRSAARRTGALPMVWVNGRRLGAGARHVSALDRGLTLADGIFETMRVYDGRVFRLDEHVARLGRAAAALEIGPLPDAGQLVRGLVDRAARAGVADASVRLTVTRGPAGGGVAPPPAGVPPSVVIVVGALPDFPRHTYESGLHAHVASGRRNEHAMTAGLKTLAYTDAVAALIEARRDGAEEALFLDTAGHCSEATSSNLFAWTGAALLTPPVSCGALPGITRGAVMEVAAELGMRVEERAFGLAELLGAREAFLTSSLREIAPLVRVGGTPIGDGAPGDATRELMAAFGALVRRECGR